MRTLNFDGLFRGKEENSGIGDEMCVMCYGWVIMEGSLAIARGYGSYTHQKVASSNGAEYLALIKGLEALSDMGLKNGRVVVIGDAKSVIDQMQGLAEVNSPRIKSLHKKARRLCQKMSGLHWQWVPRNENKVADQLTRHALRQFIQRRTAPDAAGSAKRSSGFRLIYDLMVSQRPANPTLIQ